jgi:hypothetical protein
MDGATIFDPIRSRLSTCRKRDTKASQAIEPLLKATLPDLLMQWQYAAKTTLNSYLSL